MATNVYIADRRLYLDKDGNVVEEGDPTKATLLVAEGNSLPIERARALGLLDAEQSTDEPKAKAKPQANKAKSAPQENKQGGEQQPSGGEQGAPSQEAK